MGEPARWHQRVEEFVLGRCCGGWAPDLNDATAEADESTAIEAGVINTTGFRYVGTLAPQESGGGDGT
jgi:hypothetical protein